MKWSIRNLDNSKPLNTSALTPRNSLSDSEQHKQNLSTEISEIEFENKGKRKSGDEEVFYEFSLDGGGMIPDDKETGSKEFNKTDSGYDSVPSTDRLFRPDRKQWKKRKFRAVSDDDGREKIDNVGQKTTIAGFPVYKLSSLREKREALVLQLQKAMIADEDGDRAIHIAVVQENIPLVKKLCSLMKKAGVSFDIPNILRQTPLHLAIIVGNCDIVRILISCGASLNIKDRRGNNAVQLAVKFYEPQTFSTIIAKCKSSNHLNSMDYDGFTALHHAVYQRNRCAVDGLCRAGADVNASDGKSGRTPLVHAVLADYLDMVSLLLKHDACPDKGDYAGWSAVEISLQTGNRTMMRLFEIRDSLKSIPDDVLDNDNLTANQSATSLISNDRTRKSFYKRKKIDDI